MLWDFTVYHHRTSGLLWELCLEPFGFSAVPLTINTNRSLGGNQNVAGIEAAAAAGIMCGLQPQEDAPHVEIGCGEQRALWGAAIDRQGWPQQDPAWDLAWTGSTAAERDS